MPDKFYYKFMISLSESFMDMSNWAREQANKIQNGGETNGK